MVTGDTTASANVEAKSILLSGFSDADSDFLAGSFQLSYRHETPSGDYKRITELPKKADVLVIAKLIGSWGNSTFDASVKGIGFESFVKGDAAITGLGGLSFAPLVFKGFGSGPINKTDTDTISFSEGSTAFSGSLNMEAKVGLGLANIARGNATLSITGQLVNPEVNIEYEKVPEPLTILSTTLAGGGLVLLKKRRSKKVA
ncbi:MAG: PEP-CTERM sorting domain-containing protein [Oscillatoria sp. SIO1A7]|nr:PEP-CTERM sorting domain-containing protein [Oscillatoria sp. SIO1A7]